MLGAAEKLEKAHNRIPKGYKVFEQNKGVAHTNSFNVLPINTNTIQNIVLVKDNTFKNMAEFLFKSPSKPKQSQLFFSTQLCSFVLCTPIEHTMKSSYVKASSFHLYLSTCLYTFISIFYDPICWIAVVCLCSHIWYMYIALFIPRKLRILKCLHVLCSLL